MEQKKGQKEETRKLNRKQPYYQWGSIITGLLIKLTAQAAISGALILSSDGASILSHVS